MGSETPISLARERSDSQLPQDFHAIKLFLEKNFAQPISVRSLERRFGVSRATIFREFERHLQSSPGKFLIQKRMEMACVLLVDNRHTIKQIATQVGYSNAYHFSTAFRGCLGCSPTEYRRRFSTTNNTGWSIAP